MKLWSNEMKSSTRKKMYFMWIWLLLKSKWAKRGRRRRREETEMQTIDTQRKRWNDKSKTCWNQVKICSTKLTPQIVIEMIWTNETNKKTILKVKKKAYYNNNSHIGTDDDTKVNILIGVYMWFDPFSFYYSFHYLFLDFRSLFISFHIFLHVYTCFLDCFFFRHRCCCWSSVLSCLCMKTVHTVCDRWRNSQTHITNFII